MRDLRLIGVHDDGEHLVVTDDTGEEFRLRIDEQLRAAARRDRPRLGQLQIAIHNDVRPREVQSMIRAGATAEEVAARTGWDLDKVTRFEGPIIAEREHLAGRAQTVRMRGTNQAGAPETLAQRAATRLHGRGVEPSSVEWDASRDAEGQWTVSAAFTAGGRERTAMWWFDQAGMSVVAKNDEAKWLSEADTAAGPVPAAVHRPTAVFDVEVEENRAERATRANTDELIASMREHSGAKNRRRGGRGRTRGADESPPATEDALPLETEDEHPSPARGTHPKDIATEEVGEEPEAADSATHEQPAAVETAGDREPEVDQPPTTPSGTTKSTATGPKAPDTTGPNAPDTPQSPPKQAEDSPADEPDTAAEEPDESSDEAGEAESSGPTDKPGKGRGRKGRASVPSWDDVMFGTRRD